MQARFQSFNYSYFMKLSYLLKSQINLIIVVLQLQIIFQLKSMFYYSPLSPNNFQGISWVLIQPLSPLTTPEVENTNICPSPGISLFGSFLLETKEPISPIDEKCQLQIQELKKSKDNISNDNKKIIHKNQKDQQFDPNAPELKKLKKTSQNGNRNIIPNIIRQGLSFIQKKNKSEGVVQKLINKLKFPEKYSANRFYNYQGLIKYKWNHYLNADSLLMFKQTHEVLLQIYDEEEQRHYNKMSLMLIEYFLQKEFEIFVLTSKRMNSQKKLDHLRTKRKIVEQIWQLFGKVE